MLRFTARVALSLAAVFAASILLEEALVAVGLDRGEAELGSLILVIVTLYALRARLSLDEPWALEHPGAAGVAVAVAMAATLAVWFLLTEDDRDVALGAAGLGCLLAAGCGAWCAARWRRKTRLT